MPVEIWYGLWWMILPLLFAFSLVKLVNHKLWHNEIIDHTQSAPTYDDCNHSNIFLIDIFVWGCFFVVILAFRSIHHNECEWKDDDEIIIIVICVIFTWNLTETWMLVVTSTHCLQNYYRSLLIFLLDRDVS